MAPLLTDEESALDPYLILGVVVGSTEKEITKAYRKASLKYHPDKNSSAEAPAKFREIQLSLEILSDPAKKSYIENKLESDRRRKEKYAQSDKKRKAMIDALEQREEEAKLAKIEQQRRRREEAKEEEIMDAGKRMLAEAQKKVAAATSASVKAGQSTNGTGSTSTFTMETEQSSNGAGPSRSTRPQFQQPPISSIDLTLILQFPATSSSSSTSTDLQDRLTSSYGPINHVFLKDPVAPAETGKKKSKGKGKKAIVEFKEGNWGGCWACWRDILAGQGEWEGVKVKFAAGETPEWVAWSETHRPQSQPQAEAEPRSIIPKDPPASQGPTGTALPTFSSAPNFGQSTMSDLLASHNQSRAQSRADEAERRKRESEFESMTILKMRQMERERLAEEIRREEEGLV